MTIRYYLIPAVRDPRWQDNPTITEEPISTGLRPKYLNAMENRMSLGDKMHGMLTNEIAPDLDGRRNWLRMHYIIRINLASGDFTDLDALSDVQHITRQKLINNIAALNALGVNTTGLTLTTPRKAIERRLIQWLQNRDLDFSQVTNRDEVIEE